MPTEMQIFVFSCDDWTAVSVFLTFRRFWKERKRNASVKDGYTRIIFRQSLGYCDLQVLHKSEKVVSNSILLIKCVWTNHKSI